MPASPAPATPGWDDDPAWSRPDPMTAEELEASLDRLCELDEGPGEEEYADYEPFTAEELTEISQAAADELLAVEAATTGRRDHEHNTPYEAGGRTCLCNTGPKCRHDHRLKQHPEWTVDQLPDGTFRWTTPAGRSYETEPTRYPI